MVQMTSPALHLVVGTKSLRARIVKKYGALYGCIDHLSSTQIRDVIIELVRDHKLHNILGDIRSGHIVLDNSIMHCRKSLLFPSSFPKFPVSLSKATPCSSLNMLKLKYPKSFHKTKGDSFYLEMEL